MTTTANPRVIAKIRSVVASQSVHAKMGNLTTVMSPMAPKNAVVAEEASYMIQTQKYALGRKEAAPTQLYVGRILTLRPPPAVTANANQVFLQLKAA